VQQRLSRRKRAFHNPECNERNVRINASACNSLHCPAQVSSQLNSRKGRACITFVSQ
jgi:hypothetical protein